MKKLFTLIATAIVAAGFTACTQSEMFESAAPDASATSPDNAIQFGTYMSKVGTTRAGTNGDINTTSLQAGTHANDGFGVFAYNTGNTNWESATTATANFMYNQQVKWNNTSNAWEYAPLKYWPNGKDAANTAGSPSNTATESNIQNISFFAYAPYTDAAITATETGIVAINEATTLAGTAPSDAPVSPGTGNQKQKDPTITYKLSTSDIHTSANVDLLWGLRGNATYNETDGSNSTGTVGTDYNVNLTKQTVPEKVNFNFKHALAKIGGSGALKIVADVDGNGAGLGGFGELDSKTCITVRQITIKNKGNETFKESGTFHLSTGMWSNLTDASSNPTLGALINEDIKDGTSSTIKMNTVIYNVDGSPTYSSSTWSPLGVTTTAKDVYAEDVAQGAFYLIPGSTVTLQVAVNYDITTYDENVNNNYVKINQTITNDVVLSIPATSTNKYYTLVLHLGLTSVKFSAEVANWDDATTSGAAEEIWLPSNVVSESTSVTLAAGAGATVNTAAGTTSYVINLTGLKASTNVTSVTYSGVATAASQTTNTDSDGKGAITVTLPANSATDATKSSTITITGKKSDASDFTTVVTIIQAKAE